MKQFPIKPEQNIINKKNLMRSISFNLKQNIINKKNLMRSISIFFLLTIFGFGCSKTVEKKISKELLISVENECFVEITFLKLDSSFYAKEIFDCNYVKEIYINIEAGNYIIEAETRNKKKIILFTKTIFYQTLNLEL